ncbi:hypothetical protein BDR04DRAFT_1146939 [Suillus decipiens]|nr:hypothetical protein BDR04DRAFT_1146939 [Suillus decipiens]
MIQSKKYGHRAARVAKDAGHQGIEIVDNQKESVLGRKQLADRTKEFKKIPDDEKLNSFKGLLKAYQTEIDNLTKRSKVSENAFLNVYKVLAEAPDPYPLLEAAVVSSTRLTPASKRRVEQLEVRMDGLVAQKEFEINAACDERMRNCTGVLEQDLQRQVALYRDQVRDLRLSNESNQAKLFDHSQRQDQEIISRLAEADMIMVDLERANSRVATVEQRNEATVPGAHVQRLYFMQRHCISWWLSRCMSVHGRADSRRFARGRTDHDGILIETIALFGVHFMDFGHMLQVE